MSFEQFYGRWSRVHALVALAGGILVALGPAFLVAQVALVLALWAPLSLGALFFAAVRLSPAAMGNRLPHLITSVRALASALLFAVVWYYSRSDDIWAVSSDVLWRAFAALLVVELSDFFDGRLARRLGSSTFGAVWDMENDAYFALSLSVGAYVLVQMPGTAIVIGLMRYLYVILAGVAGYPPGENRAYKLFAKVVAATLTITLIAAFAPFIPLSVRRTAVHIALGLQFTSFGWDAVLQMRSGRLVAPWQR